MPQRTFVLLPVSHVQQRSESDCLAACVDMVLKYLNAPTNYQRLLRTLRVNEQAGTPFPNLAKPEPKLSTAKNAKSAKKNQKTFALLAFFAVKFLSFVQEYNWLGTNIQRLERLASP